MVDVHVHLLPNLDDGPASMDETVALAKCLVDQGITHAVAVVHHYPGVFDATADAVHETLARAQEALAREGVGLTLEVANEAMIYHELAERAASGEILGIGPKRRYVLVELPVGQLPWYAFTTLDHMVELGLTPIVAHPERCYPLHQEVHEVRSWYGRGILAQLDLPSLLGLHGSRVRRFAEFMVRNHLVHLAGSDLHSPSRCQALWARAKRSLAKLGGADYASLITHTLPLAILQGQDISRTVPPPVRERRFSLNDLARKMLGFPPRP